MKESFPATQERTPSPTNPSEAGTATLAEMAIPIQAMLALRLYHRLHSEELIDELHPNTVDRSVRGKAMELWLNEENGEALSARFRSYIENAGHGSEPVDLSTVTLDKILDAISVDSTATLH